jgi:hypothetical protein
MTRRELLDRRIRASATALLAENLPAFCDIYRTTAPGRDKAGASETSTEAAYTGLACGVVPTSDPVEITVAGRIAAFADATIGLPAGTVVRETDEIHVRKTFLADNAPNNEGYGLEHQIFSVIGNSSVATHAHIMLVYVQRRR